MLQCYHVADHGDHHRTFAADNDNDGDGDGDGGYGDKDDDDRIVPMKKASCK